MTANRLTKLLASELAKSGNKSAVFEAKQLVQHVCGSIFCEITDQQLEFALMLCTKRLSGEPLQYLLHEWEFYSLPFKVGPGVLIPRADTEILVDSALEFLKTKKPLSVVDLCSGSGCIAVSIAKNATDCSVTAIEKSPDAFEYLKRNIALNKVDVQPILGDITTEINGTFDLLVSNPPYIKSNIIPSLQPEIQHEPRVALDGGEDGLFFYRIIADKWSHHVKNSGKIMVEIGSDQSDEVSRIFASAGLTKIKTIKDYSGNDRVIIGTVNL
ncbi:MAG: peptide chain release factor N(5)-glutamine methyltransferase [Oscillospiraceae bacterium]|nr:peptide chain release factor N(5)-glutamine methyltransferase [Oscillospiraceae bacterium]